MITLPTAVATTSASSKTGAAATTPDSTLDATPGGDSAASGENLPQGFLTLLGNRLLSLAQQGASAAPQDDTAQNVTADGKAPAKTSISDLLAALEAGEVKAAALDVFNHEPLPAEHAFWSHPDIAITPHNAAVTLPDEAMDYIARSITRRESGKMPEGRVDIDRGY